MSEAAFAPEVSPEGERALPGGRQLACLACGEPLAGRQRGACSPRCRAALSRRRQRADLIAKLEALGRQVAAIIEELP